MALFSIAFLILTYRRPESLEALLASVERQRLPEGARSRIVIWDNDGDSLSAARFRHSSLAARDDFTYLCSDRNWRMAGRRCLEDIYFAETSARSGDWVVHLDDDVVLTERWLEHCLDACGIHGWGACGSVERWRGRLCYSGQHTLAMEEIALDIDGWLTPKRVRCWRWEWQPVPYRGTRPVVFAGHRALLVSAPLAQQVRHDPAMTIGGEDLDYSLALREAGATLGISHQAVIDHRSRGEQDAPEFRRHDHVVRSWRRFYNKWGFLRVDAAREAGVGPHRWLELVCRP